MQKFLLLTNNNFKKCENDKKWEKNAFKDENLDSEFRPTRANERTPAVYARWCAVTVRHKGKNKSRIRPLFSKAISVFY